MPGMKRPTRRVVAVGVAMGPELIRLLDTPDMELDTEPQRDDAGHGDDVGRHEREDRVADDREQSAARKFGPFGVVDGGPP